MLNASFNTVTLKLNVSAECLWKLIHYIYLLTEYGEFQHSVDLLGQIQVGAIYDRDMISLCKETTNNDN